ncbi:MAG: hypothetical protein Q7N87_01330 [Candidatus Uhrbacteria bacterium]|nr:hypothetical protein [Candidatus Uhrbacteria bacterium]
MASKASARFEWISLVYLVFFALSVMSPSLIRHDYFGLAQTQLEELTIFIFGMAGIVTFSFYQRLMERREHERQQAENDFQKAQTELIESYAYIGSINRKIELLKKLADETTVSSMADPQKRIPKELFYALAAHARAAVGADAALIRFVELPRLRTEREFAHEQDAQNMFRVSNKDLRALHEQHQSHGMLTTEDGKNVLVIPSDRSGAIKGYLLLHVKPEGASEADISILKVFVNQAEMLRQQFVVSQEAAQVTRLPLVGSVH